MYKFNKKVIQPTTVMENDKTGAALQTVKKAFEGVGGLSEIKAVMKKLRASNDEIRTAFKMLMDGKSLDEIEVAMQWAGYSMAEIGTVLWEAQHLKQEWERSFRDLAMERVRNDMPAERVPDDMPAGYEEKVMRDYFQSLVYKAEGADVGTIKEWLLLMYDFNMEHDNKFPEPIHALNKVLQKKTTPQMYIGQFNDIHGNKNVKIEK